MLQEEYDYAAEMQAEILSRLARLTILHGNVHGAHVLSERCRSLTFVTHSVSKDKDRDEHGDRGKEGTVTVPGQSHGIIQLICHYCFFMFEQS